MGCSRHTLNCEANPASADYRYTERGRDAPLCCASHLVELLFTTVDILEQADIPYFIYWGTLLGAVRHGGLIPWDRDVDLGVPLDYCYRLNAVKPLFKQRGHLLHARPGRKTRSVSVYYSKSNLLHLDIDFWAWDDAQGLWRDRLWDTTLAALALFPLRRYPFYGRELWGPATLDGLFAWYGADCLRVGRREYWPTGVAQGADPRRKALLGAAEPGARAGFVPARIDLSGQAGAKPVAWPTRVGHRLKAVWMRDLVDNRFYLFDAALTVPRKVLPKLLRTWLWRNLGECLHRWMQ